MTLCRMVYGYQCVRGMCWLHFQAKTWSWRQKFAPKYLHPSNKLQGITFIETIILQHPTLKTSHITEWFLYSTVTRNKIYQQKGTVRTTTATAAPLPGAFNKLTVTDQNTGLTWLQRLDSNRCRVVPEALPHLTKLPMSQLPHKLQGTSFDLPLVSCAMRQATGHRLLNLHRHHHITAPCSTVCYLQTNSYKQAGQGS